MSRGSTIASRLRAEQAGAVSIALLLWAAIAAVLLYALFGASSGEIDKYGRVPVPGAAIIELPGGEVDVSYAQAAGAAEVGVPTDLRLTVVSTTTKQAADVDSRGGSLSEQEGEDVRRFAAVDPPAEGPYEVRATSSEAANRPAPQLAFGESPFGAIGDRLSHVGDLLTGPLGVIVGALVLAALFAPRMQRALRRRGAP